MLRDRVPYSIPLPNNMGMVRYILMMGVLAGHFNQLCSLESTIWFPVSAYNGVGGFFALSGYLIYCSYLHKRSFGQFVWSRFRRLMPAYAATVLLCAVGLSAASTLPAGEYFTDAGLWKYLGANLCFLNFLHPTLPGVFEGLEIDVVDGSLWTLKVEWVLYLSVPLALMLIRRFPRYTAGILVGIYAASVIYRLAMLHMYESTGRAIYETMSRQFAGQMMYFYSGVFCYYYFSLLMRHKWMVGAAAVAAMLVVPYLPGDTGVILQPAALTVLVVLVSMTGSWGAWECRRDDLSYNVYLIHFPLMQLCACYGLAENARGLLGSAPAADITLFVAVTAVSLLMGHIINVAVARPLGAIKKRIKR